MKHCMFMNAALNKMLGSNYSDPQNKVSAMSLNPKNNNYRFIGTRINEPLNEFIPYMNMRTSIKTFSDESDGTTLDSNMLPYGMGLFQFDEKYAALLQAANTDLRELFSNKTNYANISSQTRSSNDEKSEEFVSLFWSKPNKVCSTLDEVINRLSDYRDLTKILTEVYVPLLSSVLEIEAEYVMQAPTEIIYYTESKTAGLEQHVDNVNKTGGVLGPICSINFVESRYFDMLPCLVEKGNPFRVETNPGDLLVLDSVARILWSHAVPYGNTKGRYSIVIRPICDGVRFGNPISARDPVFKVPIYQAPPLLRPQVIPDQQPSALTPQVIPDQQPSTTEPPFMVKQAKKTADDIFEPDNEIQDFWKRIGITGISFLKQQKTASSSRDMPVSLMRNVQLETILRSKPTIWEAFGHDGADSLSLLYSFRDCHLTTMCEDKLRAQKLEANLNGFKKNLSLQTPITVLNESFATSCSQINTIVDLLYVDPKWMNDNAPSPRDEFNVLELCRAIDNDIFTPCAAQLEHIQSICFKVRYDWPVFQCIMLICGLNTAGFQHYQTMDVASGSKHHYFHVVSKLTSEDAERVTFNMKSNKERTTRSAQNGGWRTVRKSVENSKSGGSDTSRRR